MNLATRRSDNSIMRMRSTVCVTEDVIRQKTAHKRP